MQLYFSKKVINFFLYLVEVITINYNSNKSQTILRKIKNKLHKQKSKRMNEFLSYFSLFLSCLFILLDLQRKYNKIHKTKTNKILQNELENKNFTK